MAFFAKKIKKELKRAEAAPQAAVQTPDNYSEKELLEAERILREGSVRVREIIAPASFRVLPDHVELNGLWLRTLFVMTYPRYITVRWLAPIVNLNATLDIGMFFYVVPSEIILKQLRNKVGAMEAQIVANSEKGAPRDPILETALRDIEKLRDDLTQGTEKFFQFALYVTLYAPTLEKLNELSSQTEATFGSKLVYSKRAFFQTEQGFTSTLPIGLDQLQVTFNMNSSPIASSFPFISADLSSDSGILYGINRHNNSLILF